MLGRKGQYLGWTGHIGAPQLIGTSWYLSFYHYPFVTPVIGLPCSVYILIPNSEDYTLSVPTDRVIMAT